MRLTLALALLATASCATYPPPGVQCVSPCGLRLVGSTDCDGLTEAEGRALGALERHAKWDPLDVCAAVEGYVVEVRQSGVDHPGGWYSDIHKKRIIGYCHCAERRIVLGSDHWPSNALTHELAHAVQGCPQTDGCEDVDHCHWEIFGIYPAVREVRQSYAEMP